MSLKNSVVSAMIGFLVALLAMKMPTYLERKNDDNKKQFYGQPALLGDIGGTNLRLQLVSIRPGLDAPLSSYKKEKYNVKDHKTLASAIAEFLNGTNVKPQVAVIAIAGPIINNEVEMANVPQWGIISGKEIGAQLNISYFKLINDFEAVSYGLLLLKQSDLVPINGKKIVESKTRGVIGPGTGLGNSVLFNAPFKMRKRVYVLPSEGGQGDYWYIDDQTVQFFNFLKRQANWSYVTVEKSFAGPTIPFMYRFFAEKFPELNGSNLSPTSEEITSCLGNPKQENPLNQKVLKLFLKLYGNAIGNFAASHLPIGGIYLVGSVTKAFLPFIEGKDLLAEFKERHPQIRKTLEEIPIVFSKEIDLGLKGAFVFAKRVLTDRQNHETQ